MKNCAICNIEIENPKNNTKFCVPCSDQRRKEKMKEYGKNRKPENEERNKQKRNEVRKELRKSFKEKGLCNDCGKPRHETLLNCFLCHELNLKASIKFNRKRGMLPSRTIFF